MTRKNRKRESYAQVEAKLQALQARLVGQLRTQLGNVHNTSLEDPTELLDIASDGEIDYMSAVSAESGAAMIQEIQHALRKLREGTYSVCEACGGPIAKARLKARPYAVLCIKCKERQERRGYIDRPAGDISVRADAGVTVNLTDDDTELPEGSFEDAFRDVEDVEIY